MTKPRRPPRAVKRCHYCKQRLERGNTTTDHVVPLGRGGRDSTWNKVLACRTCNEAKADSWPTCRCPICREAVERHALRGVTEQGTPDGYMKHQRERPGRDRRMRRRKANQRQRNDPEIPPNEIRDTR